MEVHVRLCADAAQSTPCQLGGCRQKTLPDTNPPEYTTSHSFILSLAPELKDSTCDHLLSHIDVTYGAEYENADETDTAPRLDVGTDFELMPEF